MGGPRGVQNGSTVQQGAPIYITCPHFWDTGTEAADRVVGLTPDQAKHQTFLGSLVYSFYFSHVHSVCACVVCGSMQLSGVLLAETPWLPLCSTLQL